MLDDCWSTKLIMSRYESFERKLTILNISFRFLTVSKHFPTLSKIKCYNYYLHNKVECVQTTRGERERGKERLREKERGREWNLKSKFLQFELFQKNNSDLNRMWFFSWYRRKCYIIFTSNSQMSDNVGSSKLMIYFYKSFHLCWANIFHFTSNQIAEKHTKKFIFFKKWPKIHRLHVTHRHFNALQEETVSHIYSFIYFCDCFCINVLFQSLVHSFNRSGWLHHFFLSIFFSIFEQKTFVFFSPVNSSSSFIVWLAWLWYSILKRILFWNYWRFKKERKKKQLTRTNIQTKIWMHK